MTYDEWKDYIEKDMGSLELEYYWPKSQNFKPITDPVIKLDDGIYRCETNVANTENELEEFIENNNLAIFNITFDGDRYLLRSIDLDSDPLTAYHLDEVIERNNITLTGSSEYGSLDGIKKQMLEVTEPVSIIPYSQIIDEDDGIRIRVEMLVTDGEYEYE